jgi:hypothetical protein
MKPELGFQMLPILFKYMECGKLDAILGEIRNNPTSSFILFGLEIKENLIYCQHSLTVHHPQPL